MLLLIFITWCMGTPLLKQITVEMLPAIGVWVLIKIVIALFRLYLNDELNKKGYF